MYWPKLFYWIVTATILDIPQTPILSFIICILNRSNLNYHKKKLKNNYYWE